MTDPKTAKPLQGLLVLDLTQMASGPYATMLLAEAGATVIKIERPGNGDPSRSLPPFAGTTAAGPVAAGILRFGRSKRSLALDLSAADGKRVFRELVRVADVVWENFVPGTMERLGLGYETLRADNPRIIYASITGFGRTGSPDSGRTALDIVAQAASGLMDVSGESGGPPALVGAVIGDLVPALYGVIGTLLALRQRDQSGQGAVVDIAMVDALIAINERAILATSVSGDRISRGQLGHAGPYRRVATQDGEIVVGASIPVLWERLCRAIGQEELLTQAPAADPDGVWWRFGEVVAPALTAWGAARTTRDALEILNKHAVPASEIATAADVLASPHARGRRMLLDCEDPLGGPFTAVGSPIKVSGMAEPTPGTAPRVGEHSREVLGELLGYTPEQVADLVERAIISEPSAAAP